MTRTLIVAALFAMAAAGPGFAASDFVCDEASMAKMKTEIEAMTDKDKQTMSMQEFDMASADMKANKIEDCQKRLRQLSEKNEGGGATSQ